MSYVYVACFDSFCITHVHYITIVDVGKERLPTKNWSMVTAEKTASGARTTLRNTGLVPVNSRQ